MLEKFRQKMYNFMQGRYGMDTFGNFLLWSGMILIIINVFVKSFILSLVVLILVIYSYARILSRNYEKMNSQNQWFLDHTQGVRDKVGNFIRRESAHARIRKTHRIFTCPGCRQKIKVPKGKGKIVITCPKCRIEFTKKS